MPANAHKVHTHKKQSQKTQTTKIIDRICTVFAVFMPATSIPQAVQIYQTQDVSGLSLATWILYIIGVIPFLLYGIVHREKQLIILNALWLLMSTIIVVGILIYR